MHLAVGDQVIDHIGGRGDGNGKAETLHARGGGRAHLHRVDADDLSVHVDERAAGVAVVERGVRLNERHRHAVDVHVAVDGGDDAVGQCAAQLHAERVANGVHRIADGQRVRVAEFRGGKAAGRDLDDSEVLFFVKSQKARTVILTRVEHDVALRAARDDVGVREDEAILGEDDARADHGAAVAITREHRDGGGIDFLVNFLDRQRLAVARIVAELDLIGVGQALDGRFAMLAVVVIILVMALLKIIVVIGTVIVERAAEPQRRDDAADDEQPEHAEKEDFKSFPLFTRRVLFRLSGQRCRLHVALHNGRDRRFIAQYDLARLIALPALGDILILVIHSVCFS